MTMQAEAITAPEVRPYPPTEAFAVAVVPGDVVLTEAERFALGCWEINQLEALLSQLEPKLEFPLRVTFIEKNGALDSGMCIRRAVLLPGLYTTEIHRTRHPYVVSKGRCRVWQPCHGWHEVVAPFSGITEPGTRRVIIVEEETIWETFHATNESDPAKVVAALSLPHCIIGQPSLELDAAIAALN